MHRHLFGAVSVALAQRKTEKLLARGRATRRSSGAQLEIGVEHAARGHAVTALQRRRQGRFELIEQLDEPRDRRDACPGIVCRESPRGTRHRE